VSAVNHVSIPICLTRLHKSTSLRIERICGQGANMLNVIHHLCGWWRSDRVRRVTSATRLNLESLEARDVPAVPLAPTGLVAVGASASSISLTWTPPPETSITGYDVYEQVRHVTYAGRGSTRATYTYPLIASNLTSPTDTVTGLTPGSSHTYF